MRFYLGTHKSGQAWFDLDVPLFLSRVNLVDRKTLPRASAPWALDSAGFTALNKPPHCYPVTVAEYAVEIARYADEIGNLAWAACMDWMCEPTVLAKTRRSVRQHQDATTRNFLALRELVGDLAAPVLQGWHLGEHERHIELYDRAGVDLTREGIVGVGSICRRNADSEIAAIVRPLAAGGLRLHAFGVRSKALRMLSDDLASADSLAWSARGRRLSLPSCKGHRNEANCRRWAMQWRRQQLDGLAQMALEVAS